MLSELSTRNKVVGQKQSAKAVTEGQAKKVFLARDADERVRVPIELLCRERGVAVFWLDSKEELGRACGIEVGASVAAILV